MRFMAAGMVDECLVVVVRYQEGQSEVRRNQRVEVESEILRNQ